MKDINQICTELCNEKIEKAYSVIENALTFYRDCDRVTWEEDEGRMSDEAYDHLQTVWKLYKDIKEGC